MYISRLMLQHFRSWQHCVLDISPHINILVGNNGLGKTNIVEAIEVLSTGTSHRVTSVRPLVKYHEVRAGIQAQVCFTPSEYSEKVSHMDGNNSNSSTKHSDSTVVSTALSEQYSDDITRSIYELTIPIRGGIRAKINDGKSVFFRDIAGNIPTITFTPRDQNIIMGDPQDRRIFLDMLGIQVFSEYYGILQDFQKIVKQRASLLKSMQQYAGAYDALQIANLEAWTGQFITLGIRITKMRYEILQRLEPVFNTLYRTIAQQHGEYADGDDSEIADFVHITYEPSFDEIFVNNEPHQVIAQHFQSLLQAEVSRGTNLLGPQRDNFSITMNDMPARDFASNGEVWSMALALKLATQQLLSSEQSPIIILDDVFAQLDESRRSKILDIVAQLGQVIITAASERDIPQFDNATIIHVEDLYKQQTLTDTMSDFQDELQNLLHRDNH